MSAPLLFAQTIGALWLGKEMHPQTCDCDMAGIAIGFYQTMLGYDMSRAEAEKLLSRSKQAR